MPIKKKVKKKFAAKKTVSVSRKSSSEGFFQRMKEIIKSEMPQPEKVRVKTFIVEKPVIIHDKAQNYDSDDSIYDSKRSRYSRESVATGMGLVRPKKKVIREEDLDASSDDEQFADDSSDDLDSQGEEDLGEQEGNEDSELSEGSLIDGEDDLGAENPLNTPSPTHTRSRGMFNNIWWKKALFWAILVWLFMLAVSMAMQAMKLIMVDLTRQWWVLLGIMIVIEMVYFKFLDGKFNF